MSEHSSARERLPAALMTERIRAIRMSFNCASGNFDDRLISTRLAILPS
jgi:hypothetical protein